MSAAAISVTQMRDLVNSMRSSYNLPPLAEPTASAQVEAPIEAATAPAAAPANEQQYEAPYNHEATMEVAHGTLNVVLEASDAMPPVRGTLLKMYAYGAFSLTWLKSSVKAACAWTKDKIRQAYSYVVSSRPVRYVTDKIRAAYNWIAAQIQAGHAKLREYRWYAYICDKAHAGYVVVRNAAVAGYQWTKAKVLAATAWVVAHLSAGLAWIRQGMVRMGNWIINKMDQALAWVRGLFGSESMPAAKSAAAAVATAAVVGVAAASAAVAPTAAEAAPVVAEQGIQFSAEAIRESEAALERQAFVAERTQAANREVGFDTAWGNEEDGFAGMIAGDAALRVTLGEQASQYGEIGLGEVVATSTTKGKKLLAVGTRMGPVVVFESCEGNGRYGLAASEQLMTCGVFYQQGEMTLQDLQIVLGAAPQGNTPARLNLGQHLEELFARLIKATPGQ